MRHRKKFNHLGRKSAHRLETLSSMATALILHKRINTTVAKAKALRVYVEPLITKSKVDSTHSRRTVFSYLGSKHAVSELFRDVAQKVADRPGGYTRILKTGFRKGDSAEMCFIELVDYNTNMLRTDEDTQQRTTRRAGRRKKVATETSPAPVVATADKKSPEVETPEEAPVADQLDLQTEAQTDDVIETQVDDVAEVPADDVADDQVDEEPEGAEEEKK